MADLFPDIDDDDVDEFEDLTPDEEILEEELNPIPPVPYGFTWQFDFNEGDLRTGPGGKFLRVRENRDSLHEWIGHTLNTERFETPIFGGDIGTSINDLIGRSNAADSQTLARIQQEITIALSIHDRIEEIYIQALIPVDYDVFAGFRYTTDDGVVNEEVVNI